ncbi:flagellar hook-associated protein 3 FlgL [Arthrobacter pigmenti]|uniref:Flagellar hook-associated protein 3 FlgL n=1 Tax=Arthrobacter pigmenti TaxID=271432 RepID=A0A846RLN8_9MICC|nr:flagellar hook-associated protein FlgL [Arthrobacter pigmenti]NJC21204.1 flagellar hook-associated protein 3 FlgL [Arthrobacter pigmenti]
MIGRITNQTMAQTAQRNLQANLARLAELQDQASSRKAINRPSDDPAAAADSLRVRADLRATEQYARNIDDGDAWLTTLDATLGSTNDVLGRAHDLTLRAINGSISPAAREALAVEIESLRTELFSLANTQYQGRTVFAGNSDAGTAFNEDLTYNASGPVERRIDAGTTVRVDADGATVFGVGDASAFALLDTIAADLRSGGGVSAHLTALEDRLAAVRAEVTSVGSRHGRILGAQEATVEKLGALEAQRAGVEDIDLAQVILDMKLQETSYQAALAVTARVLQPTLMDFLR